MSYLPVHSAVHIHTVYTLFYKCEHTSDLFYNASDTLCYISHQRPDYIPK